MEEFKVKDRELMYKGKIIDFYKDTIQLPDGREAIWDYIDHKGAAAVVPVDDEGNINRDASRRVEIKFRLKEEEILLEIQNKLEVGK